MLSSGVGGPRLFLGISSFSDLLQGGRLLGGERVVLHHGLLLILHLALELGQFLFLLSQSLFGLGKLLFHLFSRSFITCSLGKLLVLGLQGLDQLLILGLNASDCELVLLPLLLQLGQPLLVEWVLGPLVKHVR